MKNIYTVLYVKRMGDEVLLGLASETIKEQLDPMSALKNIGAFAQQMQMRTSKINDPDKITIPFEEWKIHQYNIGSLIEIDIVPGDK